MMRCAIPGCKCTTCGLSNRNSSGCPNCFHLMSGEEFRIYFLKLEDEANMSPKQKKAKDPICLKKQKCLKKLSP